LEIEKTEPIIVLKVVGTNGGLTLIGMSYESKKNAHL
jgi:hypothetical protein